MAALTDLERLLVEAATAGETLDLRAAEARELRAGVVRDVLLGQHGTVDARGLQVRGAALAGPLDLDGLQTRVRLRLRACTLPGLVLRGASLPLLDLGGCTVGGLLADDAVVDGSVLLWRGFSCQGLVSFVGARVGGKLDLSGAMLAGGAGAALVADRITIGGDLMLDDAVGTGTAPAGTVQLTGARIAGRLSARRLRLTNPAGPGLAAASLHVTDMVDLSRGVEVRGSGPDGALRLVGARVGSLSLGRARLENPDGWALTAHYLDLGGTLYLDRVTATGGIRLSGGRLLGGLSLEGATVDGAGREALDATRLQVGQAVRLAAATLRTSGDVAAVDLRSARIAGDLDLRHTTVANPGGVALRLNTATVDGRAILSELVVERGGLDFRDSAVGAFQDDPAAALPAQDGFVELSGLTYRGVPGRPGVTVRERLAWLDRMPAYAAQPYRQLAAAYRGAGHEDEARRVLVAQQQHLDRSLTGWTRLRHRLFGLTLQYGYQPARAVALLAVVLAVAIGLFVGLSSATSTPAGTGCPAVDRIGLAVDTAIPLVSTGAADRCQLSTGTAAGQALAAAGWVLTLLGWATATLVVAGYSGWVRRR
jgi:hypothetical protein